MKELYKAGIFFCDLKETNILLKSYLGKDVDHTVPCFEIYLTDLGGSCENKENKKYPYCFTPDYFDLQTL
jgi:serine/threonine protein kinase